MKRMIEAVKLSPQQAGYVIGWCGNDESKAHVAAAIISSHFGIEAHCGYSKGILFVTIQGNDCGKANEIIELAMSWLDCEDQRLIPRVRIVVHNFADSYPRYATSW